MTVLATEAPRGTWGAGWQIFTVGASDDARVIGVAVAWPPPYLLANNPSPGALQLMKALQGGLYFVSLYLVTFDTSFLREDIHRVISATLKIRYLDNPANADDDGRSIDADNISWGEDAGAAEYVTADQPGACGSVPLAEMVPGQDVEFQCPRQAIIRGGLTQFRLTVSGAAPTGLNRASIGDLSISPPDVAPRLEILTVNRMPLWEMAE